MPTTEIVIDDKRYKLTLTPMDSEAPVSMEGTGGGGKKSKKEKKAKGTRKLSPYMKFAQEARKEILAKEPELKSDIIKVGKRIGEMWRALPDSEKAKY